MLGIVSTKGRRSAPQDNAWWKAGGELAERSVVWRSGPACAQATRFAHRYSLNGT
jgi:hypothetical protein